MAVSFTRELDSVKFPARNLASPRKVKRKWHSREDRRHDKQYGDAVLVPSDGGVCLSGSESDDPDWSIGWVEPHGPDFRSDDEIDDGFAVLVPCYRPGCKELVENSTNQLLSAIKNLPNEFSSDMEEKVQIVLKLIEEDGESFAKRAEMYYKKRPELIHFVEESYRAYRALADHISKELQNANNTIASVFPEQVQFAMEDGR
ncbi:hypothetical protein GH714_016956 [Hevea brasiliensis]|uniref:NAB domain-containing protein n=1 Tax=Hevea brasiliensis TaxID=3981 RepID=A0A6A6K5U1_HEVBR|nr:hypothetical protein GH714_016956 [Hevea brasiliensis]